ncbi:MAG: hypothetical protein NC114_06430 [Ruminococcus flavefaciens]|nr:hypothetical protein [Ruminococcus flavefaciens]
MDKFLETYEANKAKRARYAKAIKRQKIEGIILIILAILMLDGAAGGSLVIGGFGLWALLSKEVLAW